MNERFPRVPNLVLRRVREQRGWSQQQLARLVGTNTFTVCRWERGNAFPRSYFRQKLCEVFELGLKDLGLHPFNEEMCVAYEHHRVQPQAAQSSAAVIDLLYESAWPPLPAYNFGLIGREAMLTRLKEHLCSKKRAALTALYGLPGVGKTALAIELAQDADIQKHFPDGILWADLGPEPDFLTLLRAWATALGITASELARLSTVMALGKALKTVIGGKRLLFVIDDAWQIDAALAFKVGGPACAYLLTTRSPQVATQFAHREILTVEELSLQDSLKLLSQLAPEAVALERDLAQELAQLAGGLPLALVVMGHYLHTQSASGQPRRIRDALKALQQVEIRQRLTKPYAPVERPSCFKRDILLSLQASIAISDQYLDEHTRSTLYALSIFPPKPSTFSEEAALAVCRLDIKTLVEQFDRLTDAGLLESCLPGRYTIHRVIVDYIHLQRGVPGLEERMVKFFISFAEAHRCDRQMLDLELGNILAAIGIASKYGMEAYRERGMAALALY